MNNDRPNIGDVVDINFSGNIDWVNYNHGDLILINIIEKYKGWFVGIVSESYRHSTGEISNEILLNYLSTNVQKTREYLIGQVLDSE
jgi:hypothetical protein